ncbi:MAG: cation transporter [Treponema sp.]|nr:cation transporter [Treponema sp.]
MIKLLARIFIKDHTNYTDEHVRSQYGILCGSFGIFLNAVLFAFKFIFGTLAASVAMVADAFNNLSDAASSFVQILGFKLSSKKPDPDHPFGHGRIEYISGLIVSFIILYMGVALVRNSVLSIIHRESLETSAASIIVMVVSVLVKFYMYLYNHLISKKINSVAMEVVAKDSLNDVISTAVVIAALIGSRFTTLPLDGIGGVVVGVFILKTGFEAAKDTIAPLLGTAPSAEFVNQIEEELMKHKPIVGMHDLIVHDYGPGRLMISLHAEVPGNLNIFSLHDVIDIAEYDISRRFGCQVVIHMDPVDTENKRLSELKSVLLEEIVKINPELKVHDVRMVPGDTHTNLIFDVVKPFSCFLTDEQLKLAIHNAVNGRCPDVFCAITVDQPFVK